ncbi:BatD family protein, partial [Bacteroidota bacterium]
MVRTLIFICLFLLNTPDMFSQDVSFTAAVQKNPVVAGERFQITFTLQNGQGTRFTPPSFRGFSTLMGPSTSQNTQIMNGRMIQQVSYTYVLQSAKTGSYKIGPATVTVNGNPVRSNAVTINVVEPSEAEKQRRNQQQQQDRTLGQQAKDLISKNLFVTLSINKNNVYIGEQIVATYKIYVHPELNVQNLTPKKEPSFNGFWTQQIDLGNVNWQSEVFKGVRYKSAVIKKVILLPQQSGRLSIEPYSFDCVARLKIQGQQQRRRRSRFDDFFNDPFFSSGNYKDFPYVASSKKQVINVKSLPEPQPPDFNGGVGKMNMEAWIDKPNIKTGEPISLKVKISGSGNLKLIEPMELNFPP